MALGADRLRSIIESMLLVSADPVPIARIIETITEEDPTTRPIDVTDAIGELVKGYAEGSPPPVGGFKVDDMGEALQLRTVTENAAFLRRFLSARPQRLTKAALETLAIIAYRQPITKPDVETIRGVDVGAVLKALLERDLIRIVGKKEEVGRPILYGTTRRFLELFGLKALTSLPTLREYQELDPDHQRQVDALYEPQKMGVSELAAAAQFLAEREHDPDLDALDAAMRGAEDAGKRTAQALGEGEQPPPEPEVVTSEPVPSEPPKLPEPAQELPTEPAPATEAPATEAPAAPAPEAPAEEKPKTRKKRAPKAET